MKKKQFDNVYQFKITLKYANPVVWRRIQVPEIYTFWDLHVAIQDAMGWDDCHLHEFILKDSLTGETVSIDIPDEEGEAGRERLPGWKEKIAERFSLKNNTADYLYDFGDSWEHTVTLENILPRDSNINYPICIEGERACPPEDCGGIPGYEEICQGKSEFQEQYKKYNPEHFNPSEVSFDDPKKRFKKSLG